jgi:hypothetical protein
LTRGIEDKSDFILWSWISILSQALWKMWASLGIWITGALKIKQLNA